MRAFLLVASAALAWATIVLATEEKANAVEWIAICIVASASAVELYLALRAVVVRRNRDDIKQVSAVLRNTLGRVFEAGLVKDHFTSVSLHVWEVPPTYRWLFPYRVRRWLTRHTSARLRGLRVRPRLKHLAHFRLSDHGSSGVTFKKGYGLVGRCLEANSDKPLYVNFQDRRTLSLLRQGQAAWESSNAINITHGLRFGDAEKLAERYAGAVAVRIADPRTGEGIGVLTIDALKGNPNRLNQNTNLITEVAKTAVMISPVIALGKVSA